MLKVLITPPISEFSGWDGHCWYVAVKQDFKGRRSFGYLFYFRTRPTQRQIRRAKKIAKAAFRDYLKQGGAA